MLIYDDLIKQLEYQESSHYLTDVRKFEPEDAHLFREASKIGVKGIYTFQTRPDAVSSYSRNNPAVYVAQAKDEVEAKSIHKKLWNLANAPIIVVFMPDKVSVYTGFDFSLTNRNAGLLDNFREDELYLLLANFSALAIDTGRVWQGEYKDKLSTSNRVDKHLLNNLKTLGEILITELELKPEIAHNLIGKYVYLRYLVDRQILSDEWLDLQNIDKEKVFGRKASVEEFTRLVSALEERFNGSIFPIDFTLPEAPKDSHVALTASIFLGDVPYTSSFRQLHLAFRAYDFKYIPVEVLSAVYEQFIGNPGEIGAYYTPEALTDYLLSEVEAIKPLSKLTKILDPSCGSGIFLVLAYRRIIEKELIARGNRKLAPEELKKLLQNIYGIEREQEACYITEFSLILILLHYIDLEPPELQNLEFKFPNLHNNQIFNIDFFALEPITSQYKLFPEETNQALQVQSMRFDCIIGNPPWFGLDINGSGEEYAKVWIASNRAKRPISNNQVAEAFSWAVSDLLKSDGVVGLITPATSLFNKNAKTYRKAFFTSFEVLRVTDFASLRNVLFGGRATLPAAALIYCLPRSEEKANIIHYSPHAYNQLSGSDKEPWTYIINASEVQTIPSAEAESGEALTWKIAIWGTQRDKRVLRQIKRLFPTTLAELSKNKNWHSISEGLQLRSEDANEPIEFVPELRGKKEFSSSLMTASLYRHSIPSYVLQNIPDNRCYVRKRGGKKGLPLTFAPHIFISRTWLSYVLYSDNDFVIPHHPYGIASPNKDDSAILKALTVYLNSSLVAYYLFFNVPEWGIFRQAKLVSLEEVRALPTPDFTIKQIEVLAQFWQEMVEIEKKEINQLLQLTRSSRQLRLDFEKKELIDLDIRRELSSEEKNLLEKERDILQERLRKRIDQKLTEVLEIPEHISITAAEFVAVRLALDTLATQHIATQSPDDLQLIAYGRQLRDQLDNFVTTGNHFGVSFVRSKEQIECIVEITEEKTQVPVTQANIKTVDQLSEKALASLNKNLREQVSQWFYLQRSLRLYSGSQIHLYKIPCLIDWTQTEAMNDASDIISQVLTA